MSQCEDRLRRSPHNRKEYVDLPPVLFILEIQNVNQFFGILNCKYFGYIIFACDIYLKFDVFIIVVAFMHIATVTLCLLFVVFQLLLGHNW